MKRREFVDHIEQIQNPSDVEESDIVEYYNHFNDIDDYAREKILSSRTLGILSVALQRFRDRAVQLFSEGKSTKWVNGSILTPKKTNRQLRERWNNYIPDGMKPEVCKMAINKILGLKVFDIEKESA